MEDQPAPSPPVSAPDLNTASKASWPTAKLVTRPTRRPLKIFAFDPMLGRAARNRITVDVANETLLPGPSGSRIEVVDYDATTKRLYPPVDLNDPEVLMQGGLDPAESNPFFHQQMVYAVAMRVVENFEAALGRKWWFTGGRPLRIYPHALQDRNAYYSDDLDALLFGYFRADAKDPGANLPGQTVFTCLSHDIIAHETTHAMVDRLRTHFLEPSNPDVLAFHEGFADIVAIFQHFSFSAILEATIQATQSNLRSPTPLLELAHQFGYATGRGRALRSALDQAAGPDPSLYASTDEPHERGAILVAAVFDAFFTTYQARVADLLRIATAGSGRLPRGALHPDLVKRLSVEAAKTAQNVLTMCIRAFEYLPPVDVTYGDFLRAIVTSDHDAVPDDPLEQRNALIEGFRRRGIYPEGVSSLSLDALRWPERTVSENLPPIRVAERLLEAAQAFDPDASPPDFAKESQFAPALQAWAERHRDELDLVPGRRARVAGFHAAHRWTRDGRLEASVVVQFTQTVPSSEVPELGGLPLRGGTTVIARPDGRVRYVISKPLPRPGDGAGVSDPGRARLERQRAFVEASDERDVRIPFAQDRRHQGRQLARADLSLLHRGLV